MLLIFFCILLLTVIDNSVFFLTSECSDCHLTSFLIKDIEIFPILEQALWCEFNIMRFSVYLHLGVLIRTR